MCASWLNRLLDWCENSSGKNWVQCCLHIMLLFICSVFSCGFCDEVSVNSVPLGFEITAFDRDRNWVSKNGVFAFGFLEIAGDDGSDEYSVGIKYNLGDESANIPVWTVGGGLKVSINTSFCLAMDGRLVLVKNPSGIIMWSSNTSNLGVQKATLLDNGNLVLLTGKDDVVWESFSSPTNTLLPGQSLRYPNSLRAPSTTSISSYYTLMISRAGELELLWEHNVTYWRSPFSSKKARFDSAGVLGLYDVSNHVVWSVSSKDYGDLTILRHLRIDRDGNLRMYSWDKMSRMWKGVWQAVQDQCSVFASCGLYSICGYNSSAPVCRCLYSDSSGFRTGDAVMDYGCKRLPDLGNCRMHTSMFVMKQTVLYGLYPSHDDEMLLSETACREYCVNDATCIAATSMKDGSGRCTIKRTSFISGYKTPNIQAVSFLKVCSVPQAAATDGANGHGNGRAELRIRRPSTKTLIRVVALIVVLTVSAILALQILAFGLLYHRRKARIRARVPFGKDARMNSHYSALIRLSFEEIKELTNDFANPLGALVYKGVLANEAPVVAKRLQDVAASEKEFRAAVSTLSGTHHRNLVSVKGFCYEPSHKFLLYEYVSNGSLDKWILAEENERLWDRKLDIVLGVARGLAYLHMECRKCIAHGNLKLENVLLDENMVPKVTDFGLHDFLAKRTASSSESASERDMYMLGALFLQIVMQRREIEEENMREIVEKVTNERKFMGYDSSVAIERIVRISLWCMQEQPFLRPSIGEVVKVLEGTLSVDRPPSRLALRQGCLVDREEIEAEC